MCVRNPPEWSKGRSLICCKCYARAILTHRSPFSLTTSSVECATPERTPVSVTNLSVLPTMYGPIRCALFVKNGPSQNTHQPKPRYTHTQTVRSHCVSHAPRPHEHRAHDEPPSVETVFFALRRDAKHLVSGVCCGAPWHTLSLIPFAPPRRSRPPPPIRVPLHFQTYAIPEMCRLPLRA